MTGVRIRAFPRGPWRKPSQINHFRPIRPKGHISLPPRLRAMAAQTLPKRSNVTRLNARRAVHSRRACATKATGQGPPPVVPRTADASDPFGLLLKQRIVFLGSQVDDFSADAVVSQLLLLDTMDPTKDIKLFINSPGGSVTAGMGIYDAMMMCRCDVSTVCFGLAASMGAFLLGAGTKGKRLSMPSSRIMIHQPLGGAQGQAVDLEIQAKEIMFHKSNLNKIMSEYTGQPVDKVEQDTDRDRFMSPLEAKKYGIIDEIIGGDEAVFDVKGGLLDVGKTKSAYVNWWKEVEGDGKERGATFTEKGVPDQGGEVKG